MDRASHHVEEAISAYLSGRARWLRDDSSHTRDVAAEDPLDLLNGDPHGVAADILKYAVIAKKAKLYKTDGDPQSGWHDLVYVGIYGKVAHEIHWRFDASYASLARLSETFDHKVARVFLQTSPGIDGYGVAICMVDVEALMAKCDDPTVQVSDFIRTGSNTVASS